MSLQRPTSPLFPYTTLFRSHVQAAALELHEAQQDRIVLVVEAARGIVLVDAERLALAVEHGVALFDEDRKSTRLNSSHSSTSYAVFCLKKKTPQNVRR